MAMHTGNSSSGWTTIQNIYTSDGSNWTISANCHVWAYNANNISYEWFGVLDKVTVVPGAFIRDSSDGEIVTVSWGLNNAGAKTGNPAGTPYKWCQNANNAGQYAVFATWTPSAGENLGGSATGQWLPLSTSRSWSMSGGFDADGILGIQVRNILTEQVLAAANVQLRIISTA